jgi:hypothetical protein
MSDTIRRSILAGSAVHNTVPAPACKQLYLTATRITAIIHNAMTCRCKIFRKKKMEFVAILQLFQSHGLCVCVCAMNFRNESINNSHHTQQQAIDELRDHEVKTNQFKKIISREIVHRRAVLQNTRSLKVIASLRTQEQEQDWSKKKNQHS